VCWKIVVTGAASATATQQQHSGSGMHSIPIQISVPPVNREPPLRDFGVLRCQCVPSHVCLRCAVGAVARLRFSNVSSLAMLRTSGKT
jgi:hypothetical protein